MNDVFIISPPFKQRFGGLIPIDYDKSWKGIDPPWTRSLGGGGLNEFSSHWCFSARFWVIDDNIVHAMG